MDVKAKNGILQTDDVIKTPNGKYYMIHVDKNTGIVTLYSDLKPIFNKYPSESYLAKCEIATRGFPQKPYVEKKGGGN